MNEYGPYNLRYVDSRRAFFADIVEEYALIQAQIGVIEASGLRIVMQIGARRKEARMDAEEKSLRGEVMPKGIRQYADLRSLQAFLLSHGKHRASGEEMFRASHLEAYPISFRLCKYIKRGSRVLGEKVFATFRCAIDPELSDFEGFHGEI